MLFQLTSFELLKAFKKTHNQIYFLLLFIIGFLLVHAAAGFFDFFKLILVGETMHLNGASIVGTFLSLFKVFIVFVVAASVSSIVFVDYKYNTLSMTFTTGVSKFNFIFSKFIASFVVASVIMSGVVFGHILACAMPYLDASFFVDFNYVYYLSPFVKNYLLNIYIMTALFVTFTLLLRSSMINWILVILFYTINIVASFYFKDIDTSVVGAMIDPSGSMAAKLQVHGLSANQLDNYTLKMQGVYLWNRILWGLIGLASLMVLFFKFDFQYQTSPFRLKFWSQKKSNTLVASQPGFKVSEIPTQNPSNIQSSTWRIWLKCYLHEFNFIVFSIHFALTIFLGFAMLVMTSSLTGNMYETSSYPVTYEMVALITNTFNALLIIFIALMAGELIWRERATKCNEINDALPINSIIPLSSKIIALISSLMIFLLMFIVAGIFIQMSKGFHDYQLAQYFTSLFIFELVDFVLFTLLAFFVHTLINNKYAALMVLLVYYFAGNFGASFFDHNLLKFNGAPHIVFSDLNGYGNNVFSYWLFKAYWFLFSLLLFLITRLLWIRGEAFAFVERIKPVIGKNLLPTKLIFVVLALFLTLGSYIFYNTNIINTYTTAYQNEWQLVEYERKYKKHETHVNPEITKITVIIDMYPDEHVATGNGQFELHNTSGHAMTEIHVSYNKNITTNLLLSKSAKLKLKDEKLNYYIYELDMPLQVDEFLLLDFNFKIDNKGFKNSGSSSSINSNGTFINSSVIFPSFGYNISSEILSKRLRRKHNLPPKALALSRDDQLGLNSSMFGENSHFTNIDVTISTSINQKAFSAGNLTKQWQDNNRNYFQYKNKAKVQNFIPFVSGDYVVEKDIWQDIDKKFEPVEILIYYYKPHGFNIDKIMQSAKDSLSYYSTHFSPYAQKELRIIEFPRSYGSFAQSFPSTVPFSETMGFLTDLRELEDTTIGFEEQKIDVAYFVTAHEIAHQWWAHQVSSANVEGINFLIESLSEYSALKVMENKYGKQKIKKFLRKERQTYLLSRGMQTYEERPVALSLSSQQSIYYNKGSLSLYALDSYLGSAIFDKSIKSLIEKFAYQSTPYPTSKDFIDLLFENSPEELHYFIDDHLNKITLYDTKINQATYARNENLQYQANITLDIEKYYSDEKGKETKVDMNDLIEIGIYNSKDKELFLKKIKLKSGENMLTFKLKRKPKFLVIDPYYHVITKDFEIAKKDFTKVK